MVPKKMNPPPCPALPAFIEPSPCGGWYVLVKVQPGAKKTEIMQEQEGRLRIRLAAPAVENKANKALLEFLAKILKIKQGKLSLVSGDTSRQKRILVDKSANPLWEYFINCATKVDSSTE